MFFYIFVYNNKGVEFVPFKDLYKEFWLLSGYIKIKLKQFTGRNVLDISYKIYDLFCIYKTQVEFFFGYLYERFWLSR